MRLVEVNGAGWCVQRVSNRRGPGHLIICLLIARRRTNRSCGEEARAENKTQKKSHPASSSEHGSRRAGSGRERMLGRCRVRLCTLAAPGDPPRWLLRLLPAPSCSSPGGGSPGRRGQQARSPALPSPRSIPPPASHPAHPSAPPPDSAPSRPRDRALEPVSWASLIVFRNRATTATEMRPALSHSGTNAHFCALKMKLPGLGEKGVLRRAPERTGGSSPQMRPPTCALAAALPAPGQDGCAMCPFIAQVTVSVVKTQASLSPSNSISGP